MHSRPYGVREAEWSLNADGTVLAGAGAQTPEPQDTGSMDETLERLNRTRPQQLFETFNDVELAWGPTWSTSLKSLWVGEGEAIGDVSVGDELAEHLGSEPMHPVLMDLCTGVAFPAFPALLAAEQGMADLFLPLRYGQVDVGSGCHGGSTAGHAGTPVPWTAKPRSLTSISWIVTVTAWAGSANSR